MVGSWKTARIVAWIGMIVGASPWLVSARAAEPHSMFVTSVSGSGNLGSWADAGGHTGLAAADAICRARGVAGGVANAKNFVAWISDSQTDAYCRIHGLTGKVSANCGQPSLPTGAGPWQRVDGTPFAATIETLVHPGLVYSPPRIDELGNEVPGASIYTATGTDGSFNGQGSCTDWTASDSSSTTSGDTDRTLWGWTNAGSATCSGSANPRLLCMDPGAGPALSVPPTPGRLAFLTSAEGSGDLATWADSGGQAGLAGADAVCRNSAEAAGLPHAPSFKAWLSDGQHDAIDRLRGDRAWVRPDGILIATGRADLTDGSLFAPVNETELGTYKGNETVWSGTSSSGTATVATCQGWTSAAGGANGSWGAANDAGAFWSGIPSGTACSFEFGSFRCFSDVAIADAPVGPQRVGSQITLSGDGITPGSLLKVFVATSSGSVDVLPSGLAPTSTTPTSWTGTLPWPWPASGGNAKLLGNGFVSLVLVQTDLGYDASDAVGAVLLGNDALSVPSVTAVHGTALSATSSEPSIGTANVEDVLPRGNSLAITGSGFASAVVNLFTANGNVGPLVPSSQSGTSLDVTIPNDAPIGPGSIQVVNTTDFQASNAVSVPIGELVTVTGVGLNGNVVEVVGTGFNSLTVINLFASSAGQLVNAGGLNGNGTPKIALTVQDSHHFSFTRPSGLDAGAAYVQAINPPFIPFTSSGAGPDGAFTLP